MEPDVRGCVGLKSVEKGATVKSRYHHDDNFVLFESSAPTADSIFGWDVVYQMLPL